MSVKTNCVDDADKHMHRAAGKSFCLLCDSNERSASQYNLRLISETMLLSKQLLCPDAFDLCMQGSIMIGCRCHWGPCPPCAHFCGTPHPCGHACSSPGCHDAPPPPIPAFTPPLPPVSASFLATKPVQAEAPVHNMPSAASQVSTATTLGV